MPVGCGKNKAQSARVPFSNVCCMAKLLAGNTLRTKASNCTSPNAPRLRLSPNNSCKLTTLTVRLSIFCCAASMVARRVMTSIKVWLVFLKPSSKRSETLPPICSSLPSTVFVRLSMLCVSVVVAFNIVSLMSTCCDLPCSLKVLCRVCKMVSRVLASPVCWANCKACMASRVAISSAETLVRKSSLAVWVFWLKRSANLFKPSFKSRSISRCFSSSCCNNNAC